MMYTSANEAVAIVSSWFHFPWMTDVESILLHAIRRSIDRWMEGWRNE